MHFAIRNKLPVDGQLCIHFVTERDPVAVFALLQRYGLSAGELLAFWGQEVRGWGRQRDREEWREMRYEAVSRQAVWDAKKRAETKLPRDVREYLVRRAAVVARPLDALPQPDEADGDDA